MSLICRVAWVQLGDDLSHGRVSLDVFYHLLKQKLPSLRHIQLETVSVVDHLGRTIPVPTMFCFTWKVISSRCYTVPR